MFAILTGNESFITDAVISVVGVDTLTVLADALLLTLVRLATLVRFLVSFLSGWTITAERTDGVDTSTSFAQGWNSFALVDIFGLIIQIIVDR